MEPSISFHDLVQIVDDEDIKNEKDHNNGLLLENYDVTTKLAFKR